MDDILQLASDLGERIANHERFQKLRATESAVQADEVAGDLVKSSDAQRRKIAELEAKQQPVEPADKHEMMRLDEAIRENENLQGLVQAQADFMELMNKVNRAIREKLDTAE